MCPNKEGRQQLTSPDRVMSMVIWNARLLTGLKEIDKNRRHLVHMLNNAYDEFVMGINIDGFLLDELFKCMAHCFDCEETWMIQYSYPKLFQHQTEHELFTIKFIEIINNYKQNASTAAEILVCLNNWIKHHICETDIKSGIWWVLRT